MSDNKLNNMLSAYAVPKATEEQIELASKKAQAAMRRKIPTRPFSLLTQIKVQATYFSKWFYAQCAMIIFAVFFISAIASAGSISIGENTSKLTSLLFAFSPLFVVPCVAAVYRTISNGMLEMEAACKYSTTKLFIGKLLILGIFAVVSIVCAWLLSSVVMQSFDIRPALFSLISFTITTSVILWFGKRKIRAGIIAGALWEAAATALSLWDTSRIIINSVNIGFVWVILASAIIVVVFVAIQYIKSVSYEGECNEWNSLLTD